MDDEIVNYVDRKNLESRQEIIQIVNESNNNLLTSVNNSLLEIRKFFSELYTDVRNERQITSLYLEKKTAEISTNVVHEIVNGKFNEIGDTLEEIKQQNIEYKNDLQRIKQLSFLGYVQTQFQKRPRKAFLVVLFLGLTVALITLDVLGFVNSYDILMKIKNLKVW